MSEVSVTPIGEVVIEDESSGSPGLVVSSQVDSLGKCTIYLGSGMTIRTDEKGLDKLRHLMYAASIELMNSRHQRSRAGKE